MSHPSRNVSLAHTGFLAALDAVIERKRSPDEVRLAQLLRDIYTETCEHPAVVDIINHYAIEVIDQGEAA